MKKIAFLSASLLSFFISSSTFACSDIFINKGGYHIEARSMDFPYNMGNQYMIGYVGQKNETDVVIDATKIPASQLTSWTNKYGFFGRTAFKGGKVVDGMNTAGLSISNLYLPGTEYPTYNSDDHRPVLGIYDITNYLLGIASTVPEAVELLKSHQLVNSAFEVREGYYVKNVPVHISIRDKEGNSAVVEFLKGQVKIYEHAGDVLTNAPSYDWQLKNAAFYDSLKDSNKAPNPEFEKRVYQYDTIYKADFRRSTANLLGMPGDFSPASRFVRATVLLNNLPTPTSHNVALYDADRIIESMNTPFGAATSTAWVVIKDLDRDVMYFKDYGFYQGKNAKEFYAMPITNGYTEVDLHSINFNDIPPDYLYTGIHPVDPSRVKKIMDSSELAVFN